MCSTYKASNELITLIKAWEGYREKAYKCPAGVWTIGWGHTGGVKENQTVTIEQAEYLLRSDLSVFEAAINHDSFRNGWHLTQGQFDALISFTYNVGIGAFRNSTMFKLICAGKLTMAASEFGRWTKAGGKELPGLVKRRHAEREMWLYGRYVQA